MNTVSSYQFPSDFAWGVAAASAQIEGAALSDGKGASIWDTFCRVPGAVTNGDTLDVACDHYHLYEADADLMQQMGWRNYRLSLAWLRKSAIFEHKTNTKERECSS